MSCDAVDRAVAAARRAELARAACDARRRSGPAAHRARELAGAARAALVEDDEVARAAQRRERLGERLGDRKRRLAGAAGERDERLGRRRGAGRQPLEADPDVAGNGSGAVERHDELAAEEAVVAARTRPDLRRRGRGPLRGRERQRGAEEAEGPGALGCGPHRRPA